MSSVIVQKVGSRFHVLDEIVLKYATTQAACEEFLKRFPKHQGGIIIYGDAAGKHAQTSGASDYEMIAQTFQAQFAGAAAVSGPGRQPAGAGAGQLGERAAALGSGDVGLLVDDEVQGTDQDFEQVSYKADSNQIDKDRDRNADPLIGRSRVPAVRGVAAADRREGTDRYWPGEGNVESESGTSGLHRAQGDVAAVPGSVRGRRAAAR